MFPSESSSDDFWSLWDIESLSDTLSQISEQDCVPVPSTPLGDYQLNEMELRALAEAEDAAYDELIRECTEEVQSMQRDGATTPPLTRTRSVNY